MEILIPDTARPGDTIRIEFKIVANTPAEIAAIESECKKAVASDPRLDIQGTSRMVLGDQTLMRDVVLLSVFATVRKTLRSTHEPIDFEPLSSFEVYLWATMTTGKELLAAITAKVEKVAQIASDVLDTAAAGADAAKKSAKWLPWLAVGVLVLWLLQSRKLVL